MFLVTEVLINLTINHGLFCYSEQRKALKNTHCQKSQNNGPLASIVGHRTLDYKTFMFLKCLP